MRQQTRQIRAAYGHRLSERAGEEEPLQLKLVGHRQMFHPAATLLSGDRCCMEVFQMENIAWLCDY